MTKPRIYFTDSFGFTLIEMLIVLSILMLLLSLCFGLFPTFYQKMNSRMFLDQFSDDIHYAQSYAISHQRVIHIIVDNPSKKYKAYSYSDGTILEKNIPESIKIEKGSLDLSFYFTNNGAVNSSGTWLIRIAKETYKFTLNLGSGRFRFEKL